MFALEDKDGNLALNRDGHPFIYTSRATAKAAARILGKANRISYTIINR